MAPEQQRMDNSRLDQLLALAGPAEAGELLIRLEQDLARCGSALAAALAQGDRISVRAETHVLLAVAGAIGAVGLAEDARSLNTTAHGAGDFSPALTRRIAQDIAALQASIDKRRAGEQEHR